MTDFIKSSVAHGLKMGEFDHLSQKDKRNLIRLMARVSESSYRRGAQHGVVIAERGSVQRCLTDWRFHRDLNKSPWLDRKLTETSNNRLYAEYGVLREIGFIGQEKERNND